MVISVAKPCVVSRVPCGAFLDALAGGQARFVYQHAARIRAHRDQVVVGGAVVENHFAFGIQFLLQHVFGNGDRGQLVPELLGALGGAFEQIGIGIRRRGGEQRTPATSKAPHCEFDSRNGSRGRRKSDHSFESFHGRG